MTDDLTKRLYEVARWAHSILRAGTDVHDDNREAVLKELWRAIAEYEQTRFEEEQ